MSRRDASAGDRKQRSRRAAEKDAGGEASGSAAAQVEDLDALSFESALESLEAVVDRLEEGDLALESALASFEQGVRLARRCAGQLEAAERRIEILMSEGGQWMERPFDAQPADDGEDSV